MSAARRRNPADPPDPAPYGVLVLLLGAVFVATAVLTFSPADDPNPHVYPHADPAHNACGRVGAWGAYHLIRLLGGGLYPMLILIILGCFVRITNGPLEHVWQRVAGGAVLGVVTSVCAYLIWPQGLPDLPGGYAGALGVFLGRLMTANLSIAGTLLILGYFAFAALLFISDGFWSRVLRTASGCSQATRLAIVSAGSAGMAVVNRTAEAIKRPDPVVGPPSAAPRKPAAVREGPPPEPAPVDPPAAIRERPADQALKKVKELTFRSNKPKPDDTTGCYPATLDDWVLPPVSLLESIEYAPSAEQERMAREKAQTLQNTLRDYRIEAPVVAIETGPVITMYELQLAPGVKVSQISALSNDIARALKAPAIRVVATMAGKSTVGVEVPRTDREKVRLKELMTLSGKAAQNMKLPLFLGKDASGTPMVFDLTRMPHMLIAGTTGSGKSVCINSIIMSLLMTQRPDRVKLILVDPKMVELNTFKEVPHLMCPIVTDMHRAEKILEWACMKMDERYALLAEAAVRNVSEYNRLGHQEIHRRLRPSNEQEAAQIPANIPYVVIVIDELADLMMTSAKEVEYHLSRLAQKSRAVGIHIVVATQRPEARVVTGLIKSNMPCRCAFRVAARMDSRIVLDQNGAEVLLGQGDMLFLPPGSSMLVRAQGTFIEDGEIAGAIADLRSKGRCDFHPELMRIRPASATGEAERDELFDSAVQIILETQRGSVSLLQRRLTIGYSRASRLVDQMAEAGIVGEYKGSQAREVLMTPEDWEAFQAQGEPGDEAFADDDPE